MWPMQGKRSENTCFANSCHQCLKKVKKVDAFYVHFTDVWKKVGIFFSNRCHQCIEKCRRNREAYFKAYDISIMMYENASWWVTLSSRIVIKAIKFTKKFFPLSASEKWRKNARFAYPSHLFMKKDTRINFFQIHVTSAWKKVGKYVLHVTNAWKRSEKCLCRKFL